MPNDYHYTLQRIGLISLFLLFSTHALARRVALVIGNADYPAKVISPLIGAANDARDVSAELAKLGFELVPPPPGKSLNIDLSEAQMWERLGVFAEAARGAELALFYYSGHGFEDDKQNFLIPIDIASITRSGLRTRGVKLADFLEELRFGARTTVVVLDACRTQGARGARGLTSVEEQENFLVAYSTSTGQTAADLSPNQKNSPYTLAFLNELKSNANRPVTELFQAVGNSVKTATSSAQKPWLKADIDITVRFVAESVETSKPSLSIQPTVKARQIFSDRFIKTKGEGPEMVYVAGGSFMFGRNPNDPADARIQWVFPTQKRVSVSALAVGKYEISKAEFASFVDDTQYRTSAETNSLNLDGCNVIKIGGGGWEDVTETSWKNTRLAGENRFGAPVACISNDDATAYVEWLSKKTEKAYRLPSEEEFEYYARAGSQDIWPWGSAFDAGCEYVNGQRTGPKEAGTQCVNDPMGEDLQMRSAVLANAWGLVHVLGNISEWTASCYLDPKTKKTDCSYKIIRGCDFTCGPGVLKPTHRVPFHPAHRASSFGFRVVRDLTDEENKLMAGN